MIYRQKPAANEKRETTSERRETKSPFLGKKKGALRAEHSRVADATTH